MVAENIGVNLALAAWAGMTSPDAARKAVITSNLGLAYRAASKVHPAGVDREDVGQAAVIGLLLAVDSFDPTRGCAFSTHAHWWIQRELLRLYPQACPAKVRDNAYWQVVKATRRAETPEAMPASMLPAASLDAATVGDEGHGRTLHDTLGCEGTQERNAGQAWAMVALIDLARDLRAKARNTAKGREMLGFRLDILAYRIAPEVMGSDPLTLDQIGQAHDTSRERARQVEADILLDLSRRVQPRKPLLDKI